MPWDPGRPSLLLMLLVPRPARSAIKQSALCGQPAVSLSRAGLYVATRFVPPQQTA